MDGKYQKVLMILSLAFAGWWIFLRKRTEKMPVPVTESASNFPGVPRPGEFVSDTRQPDPSSGTAELVARQNPLMRKMPTVQAIRPEPLLMKVSGTAESMRNTFERLSLTTTGNINSRSGQTNPTQPNAVTVPSTTFDPNSYQRTAKLTLGGLR